MLLGSCKFPGSILRQFDWCFVQFFDYSLLKITISNNISPKIIFSKGQNLKLENTNFSAISDSKNFKIQKFEKRGRKIAQLNDTSHGLRSFLKLRVLGNLVKLQSYNKLRTVDFWLILFCIGLFLGGFS